jgi:hypothetical protein
MTSPTNATPQPTDEPEAPEELEAPQAPAQRRKPGPDCDPGLLDELDCKAKGIAAQAAYNAEHMGALAQARSDYDAARSGYRTAREAAFPIVQETRHQLAKVIDQLICLIDDRREVECLDQAWAIVKERLDTCGGETGGCYFSDDCDFDDEVRGCKPEQVPATIANITRRVTAAEDAFKDLIKEPTELPTRVNARKTEVEAIVTALAGDVKKANFRKLYATALVVRRRLAAVWRGFDHTSAYVDCLCCALTCQLKGHTAIAILKGREAVHKCHQDAVDKACQRLRDNTADEVMAEYEHICSKPRNGGGYGERPPEGGYGERPPEGGYGERPPEGGYGERPPQGGYGERPPQGGYGERPPQGGYGERPPEGGYGERRPERGYGKRPPQGGYRERDEQQGERGY